MNKTKAARPSPRAPRASGTRQGAYYAPKNITVSLPPGSVRWQAMQALCRLHPSLTAQELAESVLDDFLEPAIEHLDALEWFAGVNDSGMTVLLSSGSKAKREGAKK